MNKNLIIILLVVLLLALAVGYSVFSDVLTISGTANANGSFDLQFQNVEVVSFAGILEENIITRVSEDGNNLGIQVNELQYPGAGVEFSVDIVNVGTIPAKVEEVGSMIDHYIGGTELKVKGLDAIRLEHPIIQPNEKCNIHFTVEWPKSSNEALKYDGTDSLFFMLEIEYTQATEEIFSGKEAHTHEEGGNLTPTYSIPMELTAEVGKTLADIELPEGFEFQDELSTSVGDSIGIRMFKATYTPNDKEKYNIVTDIDIPINVLKTGKLIELIEGKDYGKNIDYSVTVNDIQLNNWKIFHNDGTNVKIILEKYLPQDAIPQAVLNLGLEKDDGNYAVYTRNSPNHNISTLITALTSDEWNVLAKGVLEATAKGAPTQQEFIDSWMLNPQVKIEDGVMIDNTKLYFPYSTMLQNNNHDGLWGYWTATAKDDIRAYTICMNSTGAYYWYTGGIGLRPVITLPSDLVGTLGDSVTIQK